MELQFTILTVQSFLCNKNQGIPKRSQNLPKLKTFFTIRIVITNLLKCQCMVDLRFYWFWFNPISKSIVKFIVVKLPNQNQTNIRLVVQEYFPFQSKQRILRPENTNLRWKSHCTALTSCLFCLDSAALLMLNEQQF